MSAQVESAQRLLSKPSTVVTGDAEMDIWTDQVRSPWAGTGAVIRFGWLPAKLAEVTTLMHDVQEIAGSVVMAGRVGMGAGLLRVDGDARSQAAVVERLRSSVWVGNVAVLRAHARAEGARRRLGTAGERSRRGARAEAHVRSGRNPERG